MSSGTVYSVLYSLERNRLVKGVWKERENLQANLERRRNHHNDSRHPRKNQSVSLLHSKTAIANLSFPVVHDRNAKKALHVFPSSNASKHEGS
jgi:hypothetical protein